MLSIQFNIYPMVKYLKLWTCSIYIIIDGMTWRSREKKLDKKMEYWGCVIEFAELLSHVLSLFPPYLKVSLRVKCDDRFIRLAIVSGKKSPSQSVLLLSVGETWQSNIIKKICLECIRKYIPNWNSWFLGSFDDSCKQYIGVIVDSHNSSFSPTSLSTPFCVRQEVVANKTVSWSSIIYIFIFCFVSTSYLCIR